MSLKDLLIKSDVPELPEMKRSKSTGRKFDLGDLDIPVVTSVPVTADVDALYKSANLDDRTKSIYKVDEMRKVLDPNMPLQQQKKSIIGMLPVVGLNVEELITDAEKRTAVLTDAKDLADADATKKIGEAETKITELSAQIDALRQQITETTKLQEEQEKAFNSEIQKIEDIKAFLSE